MDVKSLTPGQLIEAPFLLKRKELLPFRERPGFYLSLLLGNQSGEIEGKLWEEAENWDLLLRAGDVVALKGVVVSYEGRKQIKIVALQKTAADPAAFLPASPRNREEMQATLMKITASVRQPFLSALLKSFFTDQALLTSFSEAPAAKENHQAYRGGLCEHTLNVAAVVESLAKIYPQVDRDLLVTGALIHDLGKIRELNTQGLPAYTPAGTLLGHIILGTEMVAEKIKAIPGFPEELKLQVLHLIASHHGEYEWQSPKRPEFLEAQLLHRADLLDSEVAKFSEVQGEGVVWHQKLRRHLYLGEKKEKGETLLFGGIDPTASPEKKSGCALLNEEGALVKEGLAGTDAEISAFFQETPGPVKFIGLDAPCSLPLGLHRCCFEDNSTCTCTQVRPEKGRFCEQECLRLGFNLYLTTKESFAKSWIRRGLRLAETLQRQGHVILEVYPTGAKKILFGSLPNKGSLAGRRQLQTYLQALIPGVPSPAERTLTADELDAILAAYTAYLHFQGKTFLVGDAGEGFIILPAKPREE